MTTRRRRFGRSARKAGLPLAVLAASLLLVAAQPSGADRADQAPPPRETAANVYLAGFGVRPAGPVSGDLYAAGCPVSVDQPVGGDAVVAGCTVDVKGPVGDDLRAAGGRVAIDGKVGGEAIAAGGDVALAAAAGIGGRAVLAGGAVRVAGTVDKDLEIYAGKAAIAGEIAGDTSVMAEEIEILPGARLKGALTYTSRAEAKIDPAAQILGKVTREPAPQEWGAGERRWAAAARGFAVVWLLGLIAAGAALVLVFPGFARAAPATLGAAPWQSAGLGAAVLFAGPAVVLVLLVTIIGIPIALALLAAYAILLLLGYLTLADFIGERMAERVRRGAGTRTGWRIAALAVALILLALIRAIPFVGWLVILVGLIFGIGAAVLQLFSRYRSAT